MECSRTKLFHCYVVLLKAMNVSRNEWSQARVIASKSKSFVLVGIVYLKIDDQQGREKAKDILQLPINKIAWKVMCSIPTEEPTDV